MPRKIKPLSTEHLAVASLLAQGKSEEEIARHFAKSRSWVQSLKRRGDLMDEVEKLRQRMREEVTNNIATPYKSHFEKIREFRDLSENLAMMNLETTQVILLLIKKRLEQCVPGDISLNKITNDLRAIALANESSFNLLADALGVGELTERIQQLGLNKSDKLKDLP